MAKKEKTNKKENIQVMEPEVIDLAVEDLSEEAPVEEAPVEEVLVEETPAEETPVEETSVEEIKKDAAVGELVEKVKAYFAGNQKRVGILAGAIVLVILIAGIVGFNIYENSIIYKVCRVEAGIEVSVADFLKKADENATFAKGSDEIDITVPGKYQLKIKTGAFTHSCTLYIQDTVKPEVTVNPVYLGYGDTCKAEDFINQITDATATKVAFVKEPDFKKFDEQKVEIVVTDAADNATTVEVFSYTRYRRRRSPRARCPTRRAQHPG